MEQPAVTAVGTKTIATLAKVFNRCFRRLKSTDGRPSAPLGSRILTNSDDIFKHNMWDHVQWTEEDKEKARQKAKENSLVQIPFPERGKFVSDACHYWDTFYEVHRNKFFKDRTWLFSEFPELLPLNAESQGVEGRDPHAERLTLSVLERKPEARLEGRTNTETHRDSPLKTDKAFRGEAAAYRILEVGCGVGNSVIPIVKNIREKSAFLYCCDFSPCAIQLLKDHPDYDESVCHAFVHDLCDEEAAFPFPPHSLDVILAVFVLSSINPERTLLSAIRMQGVVNRLSKHLKHGGMFLFRDYGRYDFTQLRFKTEEVHNLFSNAGLTEVQNVEDRRLQVNRKKKVAIHRVWMQSKYRKSPAPS
ncbi:mRNA N(3)-methylcytidine methyltransferase METTL8 isoform X5 [Synchiropus splendidus]|uniref:mRNA N(3)-methylcytidine methyltransferase METTL8 isoform X5 n=1 Tax=Synchiropus splendidus TaxID=270530 RepID=UPI00237EA27E|nr:mRNA N(3)-methylcytidine methyltransferase METTL8 isoform X5 [Synchiropus splendidus]